MKKNKNNGSSEDEASFLRDSTQIDPTDVQAEFIRLPGDQSRWNTKYSSAMEDYLMAKLDREKIENKLVVDPTVVEAATEALGKKPTVDQVKAQAKIDDRYQEAKRAEIRAEVRMKRIKGVIDAITSKRDMLISLGAHIRSEGSRDPVILDQVAKSSSAYQEDTHEFDLDAASDDDDVPY